MVHSWVVSLISFVDSTFTKFVDGTLYICPQSVQLIWNKVWLLWLFVMFFYSLYYMGAFLRALLVFLDVIHSSFSLLFCVLNLNHVSLEETRSYFLINEISHFTFFLKIIIIIKKNMFRLYLFSRNCLSKNDFCIFWFCFYIKLSGQRKKWIVGQRKMIWWSTKNDVKNLKIVFAF